MPAKQPLSTSQPQPAPTLGLAPSCSDKSVQVRWSDLPLACPIPGTSLWDARPRVYLSIHHSGREVCPWCGTVYILQAPTPDEPGPNFCNLEIAECYERALQDARGKALPGKPYALTQDKS